MKMTEKELFFRFCKEVKRRQVKHEKIFGDKVKATKVKVFPSDLELHLNEKNEVENIGTKQVYALLYKLQDKGLVYIAKGNRKKSTGVYLTYKAMDYIKELKKRA